MPVRLSPLDQPGADAILVGDPRRAFVLGQALTVQPEMSHLARGLWGYGGRTEGGLALTVQATGVGGPSAVAVIADLAGIGVRRIVRLGSCVGVAGRTGPAPLPGSAFLVNRARGFDGASRALQEDGGEPTVDRLDLRPDPALYAALADVAPASAVASHDLVLRLDRTGPIDPAAGCPLRDLQTAATFAVAERLRISAAAVLVVVEDDAGSRLSEPELESRFEVIGRKVVASLELPSEQH